MSKSKFKIGDFVKLKKNVKLGDCIDGYTIYPTMFENLQKSRQIQAITHLSGQGIYVAMVDGLFFPFNSLKFATAPEKIIIYRNGAEVVAKNTATGKTGVARCNPADEFDFNIGAKLAFERLTNPEPEKPKPYSGKIICVSGKEGVFTKGKVYTVKNGTLLSDDGFKYPFLGLPFVSVQDINERLEAEFIELIE